MELPISPKTCIFKVMSTVMVTDKPHHKRRIAAQVRNTHMLTLILILIMVAAITTLFVTRITGNISESLAFSYAAGAIEKFNTYLSQEFILARKASLSTDIADWFADEENPAKKAAAHDEMTDYIGILPNTKLYFGIHESLHEYFLPDSKTAPEDFILLGKLDPSNSENDWYFDCVKSHREYTFSVDTDKPARTRHIWINHKVFKHNDLVGIFCLGLPFEELAANLFAQYDNKNVTGYIIDKLGYIQMDSALSNLYPEDDAQKIRIHTFSSEPLYHSELDSYLDAIHDYFGPSDQPKILKLGNKTSRHVSIAPIPHTDWSVVTFFNRNSLYGFANLLPLLIAMLSAFLIYALVDSISIQRLVFSPLNRLTNSLTASNFYISEIFGCDRHDEIGLLAQTIQKMRDRLSTYNAELLRAARERERLIRIDQLTDIPNRRSFDERLPLEWGRAIRTKTPISILILDLDLFKNYNDTYGHLQGDKALQVTAKLFMQELKRSGDIVARWGGEEFSILLSNTDIGGALDVAERIRQRVENMQIPLIDGTMSKITVSIGVNSLIPTASSSLEDFIHHADMALYTAKREGRNRVCLYKGIQL